MGVRVVNGNTSTEDGWPLVDQAGCTWITIPGCNPSVTVQSQTGIPATLGRMWIADLNAFIEKVRDADTGSWTEGNSVLGQPGRNNGSNHLGGTAWDVDWNDHPMGPAYAGYSQDQIDEIRRMREFYKLPDGTYLIWWAEDWTTPKDSMHFQMGYGTFERQAAINDWIAKHARADGFSTYRRGNAPADTDSGALDVLCRATGITADKAKQILPTLRAGLVDSQCTSAKRIAMWLGQVGEESGSFVYTEEIAKNGRYAPYIGRTWIQITWQSNYAAFSQWCYGKGLIQSPTFFVDNPVSLADLQWAGIGPAWYWTVQRPQINSLCDKGDILGVTKAINGGTNGLSDRTQRYNRALALGDQLLALINDIENEDDMANVPQDQWDRVFRELTQRLPSRSPLRYLDQTQHYQDGLVDTMAGFELNIDGMTHVQYCIDLAKYNHPPTMALLNELAGGDPAQYPDRADDIKLAQAILNKVATDKVTKATGITPAVPVTVNSTITPAIAQDIANQTTAAVLQQLQPAVAAATTPVNGTTGQLIGQAFDSLEALKGAQSNLSPQAKATVDALIGVLQSETGVSA
jgi:predicted chitinase